jgi:type I restriction enzyme S subunit
MSDWLEAPLAELADIRVSNVDKKTSLVEKAVKLCNYMDVYSNDYIRADIAFMEASATSAEIARFKVDRGDVLITKDSETPDDIGIPAVVIDQIENFVCGYHLALIKPKRELVDPVYLSKQLGTDRTARYFGRYAAGSTRYGLSNGAIANTIIPLAPLADQKKIARILTSIDTAIEKTESLIAKYQKIKAGLMHDLFTRGVTADGKLRSPREQAPELYQETAIGWIPKNWKLKELAETANIIDPQPDHRTPAESLEGIPYVGIGDFDSLGELDLSACRKIVLVAYEKQRIRFTVEAGDVIYGKIGTIGQPKRLPYGRYALSANVILFQPKIHKLYFGYVVSSAAFEKQISDITNTTSQPALGIEKVRNLLIPVPTEEETILIANTLASSNAKLLTEQVFLGKLKHQKLGLMQDLLTGKMPVKIDEPDQEFA